MASPTQWICGSHSVVSKSATPWTPTHQLPLSSTISQSLLKFVSIGSVMLFNHLILCHPLLLLASVRVFSNESALHIRWPKYQGFSFSSNPLNDYSGLISFRTDCTRDSQESSAEKEVATNSMDSIQLYLFPIMIISSFLQLYHNLLFLPCCIGYNFQSRSQHSCLVLILRKPPFQGFHSQVWLRLVARSQYF